jgi:hypothetical protein
MGTTTQQTAAQKAAAKAAKEAEAQAAKEAEAKAQQDAEAQAAKEAEAQAAKEAEALAAKEAEAQATKTDAIFDANPKLDMYYKTSDGTAFYTQNAAELYARGLENATIKTITK